MRFATRARAWLPLLPVLGILAVTYWLDQQAQPETAFIDSNKRHTADAIVENIKATTLNQQGTPHFIMAAQQLVHYADDDTTILITPQLTVLAPERSDVRMTAQRGKVSNKGDMVELYNDVTVVRAANVSLSELQIHSDYLKIYPERELLQTNRAVTISDANNQLNAVGLEMDNRAQTLKLISQVKALHVLSKN